ncbi:hypothetical protein CALVIDRAFT_601103 [Calocera viscosa TUFC12733]|uniref:protein-histidine N-methyltransferase n=1 Tax=Calocera viscosa (strain TUFC12733) TaxID=1330018 RepID=A0A167IVC7_CALVF|nr:hypothetical protein CALVIDRAFT_601103 [Calocera viscosa TUFC12733]
MFQFNWNFDSDGQDEPAQNTVPPPASSPAHTSTSVNADPPLEPSREIPLTDLLRALPSELTYTVLSFPGARLPRRDFHDARLSSLAATADAESECAGEELLREVFDERSDVRPGVYEGGMKTWEGAGDLVGVLSGLEGAWGSVLEIGCGTAIPTLYLLAKVFAAEGTAQQQGEIRVCLQDYNRPVLELMTFPNILLTWYLHSPLAAPFRFPHPPPLYPTDPLSLRLEPALIAAFLRSLSSLRLHLSFFSGSWDAFAPGEFDWVLTSETIYRPPSLPSLVSCIKRSIGPEGKCLLAAKDVYFGVGGSVREFEHVASGEGLLVKRVWETREGSGRCVLEVRAG